MNNLQRLEYCSNDFECFDVVSIVRFETFVSFFATFFTIHESVQCRKDAGDSHSAGQTLKCEQSLTKSGQRVEATLVLEIR